MSRHECPFENENCKYYDSSTGCFSDTHHRFWPRDEYTSQVEKHFRGSFVTLECRAVHDEIHAQAQPEHPSRDEMFRMLGRLASE